METEVYRKRTLILVSAYSNYANCLILTKPPSTPNRELIFKVMRKGQKLSREILKSEEWTEKLTNQITNYVRITTNEIQEDSVASRQVNFFMKL